MGAATFDCRTKREGLEIVLKRLLPMDETGFHQHIPEIKQQSEQLIEVELIPKNATSVSSAGKVMASSSTTSR